MIKAKSFISRNNWVWAALGALLLSLVMCITSQRLNLESLIINGYTASFLAFVALGQMLVVTSGRGAIDLSIPGVITLTAYLSMSVINGQDNMLLPALIMVVIIGCVIGFLNSMLVIYLRIPPIIATMAMNYILISASLIINRGFTVFNICPVLLGVARNRILGIPIIIYMVIMLAVLIHLMLIKTTYGNSLIAMGQNYRAAKLAGVRVVKVEILAYVFSSVLAAIGGVLISARIAGAFLGMGDPYMMETVASIVVGGTLMSGGRANTAGTLVGCLFLGLISTAMKIMGLSIRMQNIAKGILIILVLAVGMLGGRARRPRRAVAPVEP